MNGIDKPCRATARGLPMLRALFIEYPNDPGSWTVEYEYLFGSDILVAPFMEAGSTGRDLYLPPGQWIDYQTRKAYSGGWQSIRAAVIPVVMLVREGAAIAHMKLAQTTKDMDWANLDLVVYATNAQTAQGLVCLPVGQCAPPRIAPPRDGSLRASAQAARREIYADGEDVFRLWALRAQAKSPVPLRSCDTLDGSVNMLFAEVECDSCVR